MRFLQRSIVALNAEADAIARLLEGGRLCLYDVSGNALVELPFPAFSAASEGRVRAVNLAGVVLTDGDVASFEATQADRTPVLRGTVGIADADLVLTRVGLVEGSRVEIGEFTYVARSRVA